MLQHLIEESPHKSFRVIKIANSVAICEANEDDRFNWGNATENKPAFLVYLGCKKSEVSGYIKIFNNFYNCNYCEPRKPKYLTGFEAEIKVRGMVRKGSGLKYGLNDLLRTEATKHQSSYNIDLEFCIADMADNLVYSREEYIDLSPTVVESFIFEAINELLEDFSTDPQKYISDRIFRELDRKLQEQEAA